MAKKYSSLCPKVTSPFAQEKQQSNTTSNPQIYLCLVFPCKYVLGNQSKAFVMLSGLALTVGS